MVACERELSPREIFAIASRESEVRGGWSGSSGSASVDFGVKTRTEAQQRS